MNYLEMLKTTYLTTPESVVTWLETLNGRGVKWKYSANANQIVFKTDDYYYKAYAFDEVDKFNSLIRHAFAEVYRSYGIDWEITTIKTDNGFLDIERREILKVCEDWYDDILINYSNTLKLVEEKLCFNDIVKQIQEQYKFVFNLKLVRNCTNKQSDYAIYKDKVILLDDADFFIYMLNERNKPIPTQNMFIKINLFDENYTFTHQIINPQLNMSLGSVYDRNDKFFLYRQLDIITRASSIKNEFQKMLLNNIELLTTNDDNKSIVEDLSQIYSPFKKTFYCTNSLENNNFLTHNRVAIQHDDISKNKTLWDDICYEYVSRNLCAIYLYTSFYDNSISELCELLNQAKLCSIHPINGYSHTGITLYVQWNIIKDNILWEENFNYIKQHYPNVKITVNVILNEPFLQSIFEKKDIKIVKEDNGIKILYGGYDDTPKEYLPRRKSMLKLFTYDSYIFDEKFSHKIYKNSGESCCEHHKYCLPYYDSDKCSICDFIVCNEK